MGQRIGKKLHDRAAILGTDGVVADLQAVSLGRNGYLGLQCIIDNGAGGAPSDTPVGAWELYVSGDGVTFEKLSDADTELAKIAPNGNNRVSAFASFSGIPGVSVKVRYNATSGGTGNSRATLIATTDE